MTHGWIALLLLLGALEKGRLCIGAEESVLTDGRCMQMIGSAMEVAPSAAPRLFVWTSDDGATAHLGTIAPQAATISLDRDTTAALELSLAGERSRGWPADVSLIARGRGSWQWLVPAENVASLRRIRFAKGTYGLFVEAARHRPFRRHGLAIDEPRVSLGEVRLLPLLLATGTVVDAENQPIPAAQIAFEDGAICAEANEQGAFACELPVGRRLEVLVVSKDGFGPKELNVPPELDEDHDFGRVQLTAGRALTLKIIRPESGAATVTLFLDAARRYHHSKLKSVSIREREEEVRFDAAEGAYLVAIEGEGELEALEVPVEVKNEDVRKEIAIEPYRLSGTLRLGEDPLAEGHIELIAPQNSWRATARVHDGTFGGTMWQHGSLAAFVFGAAMGGGYGDLMISPELGADPSRWDIRLAKRTLAGRVFDAATGQPVEASIDVVASTEGDSQSYFFIPTKPDGTYDIFVPEPATYTLRVNVEGYVPVEAEVRVAAEDTIKKFDIALEAGIVQPIDVVTSTGTPIPNAPMLEGVQPDGVNPRFFGRADAAGRFLLRGKPGETRLLYFVPEDGSLGVARVRMPRTREETKPLQVVIAPSASLRVRIEDPSGKPIRAGLLFRYNGEFLPWAILRFATGDRSFTGSDGETIVSRLPAGSYEIWALTEAGDEMRIIESNGTLRPPARVGLSGGEASVTLVAPTREKR